MRQRQFQQFRPSIEFFEPKQLPSAGVLAGSLSAPAQITAQRHHHTPHPPSPGNGFTLFRITDPKAPDPTNLFPPFQQVLVQNAQPVPGQVYNILQVAVKNGTGRTFDANSGFFVKVTGQHQAFPVLVGNQQWKPQQFSVFYVLTKQYFPVISHVINGGFVLDLAGSVGTVIPGPSAIFLRVKYNPATFPAVLNHIVVHGPGAKGHTTGLADTAIWEFVSSNTDLIPL
jgi:hypothetical protein